MTVTDSLKIVSISLFAIVATLLPELSFAAAGTEDKLSEALCGLHKIATGKAGKAIATLAVIFVGLGAFFGKASWGLVLLTAVGIGLVFGAGAIATALGGSGDGC